MATQSDVRRVAMALPGTEASKTDFAFSVTVKGKSKGYAWVWKERVDPKKPRVPNPAVLAVRVANLGQKDALLAADSRAFFTEPHYNGFPAVLVRLKAMRVAGLRVLLRDAWECMGGHDEPATARQTRRPRRPRARRPR